MKKTADNATYQQDMHFLTVAIFVSLKYIYCHPFPPDMP